jgi:hypothetical protein
MLIPQFFPMQSTGMFLGIKEILKKRKIIPYKYPLLLVFPDLFFVLFPYILRYKKMQNCLKKTRLSKTA